MKKSKSNPQLKHSKNYRSCELIRPIPSIVMDVDLNKKAKAKYEELMKLGGRIEFTLLERGEEIVLNIIEPQNRSAVGLRCNTDDTNAYLEAILSVFTLSKPNEASSN